VTAPARPRRPADDVAPAGPRLAAPARAERSSRRRAWRRRVLRALVWLLPLVALAWVLLASPWLAVDRVQVTGLERLSAEQVAAAAAVADGTPLALVDVGAAGDRVRGLDPVDDVRVRRVWPATLRIEVSERVPVAGVEGRDGVLLLDRDGVGFLTEPGLPPGVPRAELTSPGRDDPATRRRSACCSTFRPSSPARSRSCGPRRPPTCPSSCATDDRRLGCAGRHRHQGHGGRRAAAHAG
jgi:cell division protein FtsQ